TLSPQRNNARRAQLPAPGRAPTPPAHAAPYHRTARVTAPVPRANRRRNAMLFAAGFLMLAAIAIVVIVGLSGPEIDRRGKGGSGGSGGSAGAISSNGSGGGSTTTVHAPVTAQADAASAAAGDTGTAGDAGTRSATRADASRSGTSVTVESSPKKATVYLDGVKQCPAKCTVEGLDPNHTYLLSVRLRNYVPWSQLLRLGERRHVSVKAYLSEEPDPRNTGYLLVHVTPAADVTVDGTRIGRVTGDGRIPLSPGSHEIMLTRGERKLRFLVDIKKGQITSTEKLVLK
ncbi:MAG: PEGA domain-containing protein, partial [Myxococcales bacterium]|nr:PEGA domain-containing protein [Myxococcales bacterium]